MFALSISKPRFKSIIFNQNSPKMKLFLQKMQNFRALGALPLDPKTAPPHCEFLATRLDHSKGMFYLFVVGLHPTLGKKSD